MKKYLFLAAVCVSTLSIAQNPTDKGWRSVGGTGNLHFDLDASDGTDNYFNLAPEVYWFVGNSFGLGTDFGFSSSTMGDKIKDTSKTTSQSVGFWVTPGFHFYFRDPEKAWRPYMFLNAGFSYTGYRNKYTNEINPALNYDNSSSTKGFRGYTGAGLAWFFSDHAAFDIRLRVLDLYPGTNSNGDPEMKFGYNPDFMIGVQAFFD